LCYQVLDGNRIRLFTAVRRKGPDFPYKRYPKHFERRPLALDDSRPEEILRLVRMVYAEMDNDDAPRPSAKEQKVLRRFFGHRVVSTFCTIHHQFGGVPLSLHWAMEVFRCPNPSCRSSTKAKGKALKFLAGVLNDPWGGLPMVEPANKKTKKDWNYYVHVQFHICSNCWTIYACNRCD
jgi:hypothetical protein